MSKQDAIRLDQAKNKITGWLDGSNIKWGEISAEKRGKTNFMIKIGEKNETLVYDSPRHHQRIVLKQTVKLGDKHRELTKNMQPKPWNELVLDIQDKTLTYGIEYYFDMEKGSPRQINFVDMYGFIYIDDLSQDRFFHELSKLEQVQEALFNRISFSISPTKPIEPPKEGDRPGVL